MYTQGTKLLSLIGAFGVAAVVAVYVGWSISRGHVPYDALYKLHEVVVSILLATWLIADSQERRRDRPTFDQGGFVLFLFLVYVPYYLFSTRRARGVLIFGGMVLLLELPRITADIVAHVSYIR
jgi:hypothetical protein